MTSQWINDSVREPDLRRVAELLAFTVRAGDVIAMRGALGAGKTTLARAVVRALLADETAEVPSPTFSLLQVYATPRFPLFHFDLYRLASADEAHEIGLDATQEGVALIEWPERAEELLPPDRLEVRFEDTASDPAARRIVIEAYGAVAARLDRLKEIDRFLSAVGWADSRLRFLQGDASPRRYGRLVRGTQSLVLMDAPRRPDGPPIRGGQPYSRIAKLAEDVRPYVAVAGALRAAGLSAPEIPMQDLGRGLLLVEDLGEHVFSTASGGSAEQAELWQAAVEVLVHLRRQPLPGVMALADGSTYRLPTYDRPALEIELELLLDWYWPGVHGTPATCSTRRDFLGAWREPLEAVLDAHAGWTLRDFHSPNLLWRPERKGLARVGILDFQDALEGHPAYDLVSLLQDARVDVPAALERALFEHYCARVAAAEPAFDRAAFARAYAVLGAQRNTKILGIFTRLARRDGKAHYLQHMPRIWRYLARNLAHATLRPLEAWYEMSFPGVELGPSG